MTKRREGNAGREMIPVSSGRKENLGSQKAQESMRFRPELKPRVQRGAQLSGWDQAVEAPV